MASKKNDTTTDTAGATKKPGLCDVDGCTNEWTRVTALRGLPPVRRCAQCPMPGSLVSDLLRSSGRIIRRS